MKYLVEGRGGGGGGLVGWGSPSYEVRESEETRKWTRPVFPATIGRQFLALARSKNTHALQLLWRGLPLFS